MSPDFIACFVALLISSRNTAMPSRTSARTGRRAGNDVGPCRCRYNRRVPRQTLPCGTSRADCRAGHGRRHGAGRCRLRRHRPRRRRSLFNTAMTGYEEILTDPSYAGQIITFTFPHIGNVGTNEDDIETVNLAATPGARGVIVHSAMTQPSNYRASRHLDAWLKARGIIGLAASTPARSPRDPRERHAQRRDRARAVRTHSISMRSSARRRNGPACSAWISCRW